MEKMRFWRYMRIVRICLFPKVIWIIGDPGNRSPDNWNSTVLLGVIVLREKYKNLLEYSVNIVLFSFSSIDWLLTSIRF